MFWEQSVRYAVKTDRGLRRQNNEDNSAVRVAADAEAYRRHGHLFVVADGMGGHAVGELASKIAVDTLPQDFLRSDHGPPAERLRTAVEQANAAIHAKGQANADFARMGTTCTALTLGPWGALIGHVGDSRCYRVRGARVDQLTFDHSLQWELIRRGMKPDEVMLYEPRNVITRSLGPEPGVQVDVEGPFAVLPGDTYVLCSDGLTGHVNDAEIGAIGRTLPPAEAAKLLVDLANLRGGTDNVTVVVARAGEVPEGADLRIPPDPTTPPSAWPLAAILTTVFTLVAGGLLVASGHFVVGTLTAFASLAAVAAAGFRLWQQWYRRPREYPLHNDDKATAVWRPYRSAPAELERAFVTHLARAAAQLERAASEEKWAVDHLAATEHVNNASRAATAGDDPQAFREYARAIHVRIRGLLRTRRRPAPLAEVMTTPQAPHAVPVKTG